jgi:hypothetical protein
MMKTTGHILHGKGDCGNDLKQAGGNPKITIYPDAKHDAWTATYNNQVVWKWLAEHKLHEKKP